MNRNFDTNSTITVSVPATTANLGPGFDCIGAALSWHNRFHFTLVSATVSSSPIIQVEGKQAEQLSCDRDNLLYRAFMKLFEVVGQSPPGIKIEIELAIPLARGLGSSATAIVGGLMGANALAGSPLNPAELLGLAIELEGHPDNVVPALLGGCRLAVSSHTTSFDAVDVDAVNSNVVNCDAVNSGAVDSDVVNFNTVDFKMANAEMRNSRNNWQICEIPWHPEIIPILAIPDFELSTQAARHVLPQSYDRTDTIFNIAHLGLLIRALETGNADWLSTALFDRIHQPYRQGLIPGFASVKQAAISAGAYGVVISGAGPTVLALGAPDRAEPIAVAMEEAWVEYHVIIAVRPVSIDTAGAFISSAKLPDSVQSVQD